jgi:membrane protease YdiL (CAAX protease family)
MIVTGAESINKPIVRGQPRATWPMLLVFTRLAFALAAQLVVALIFFGATREGVISAGTWWPVYAIVIDAGCFALITWRIRKERIGFTRLIGFESHRFARDVLRGLLYVLWVFPLAMGGIIGCSLLVFGSAQPPAVYTVLPAGAAWYSLIIFPLIWGLMEQSTYNGFCLPRLETSWQSRAAAVIFVAIGWGLQHIALPFTFDPRFMLFRFLSFLPLATAMTLVYLRTRRLIPFVVAHWAVDMLGILTGIIIPMLTRS